MAWSAEVKNAAAALIRDGFSPQEVSDLLHVPKPTVYTWMDRRRRYMSMNRPMKWEIVNE